MTVSKYILIFSILFFTGCQTNPLINAEWKLPSKPETHHIEFVQKDNGLYLTKEYSVNLLKNVEEMDAYVAKLEAMVKEMKKYYGAK